MYLHPSQRKQEKIRNLAQDRYYLGYLILEVVIAWHISKCTVEWINLVKSSANLDYSRTQGVGSLAEITNCENKNPDVTISTKLEMPA